MDGHVTGFNIRPDAEFDDSEIYLTGTISPSLANLAYLTRLDFSRMKNHSGSLPAAFGAMKYLTYFDVRTDKLSGSISASYGGLTNLTWLSLGDNSCEIGCQGASHQRLETSDPTSDLKYLHLGGNRLAGITPSSRFNQDFDLHGNNLSGGISSVIGHTNGTLAYLDFSNNRLTGSLPSTIGNLKQLVFLDLSHTNLTGSIPPSFGNLVELGHLTLDDNQLSGGIPEVLATNLI